MRAWIFAMIFLRGLFGTSPLQFYSRKKSTQKNHAQLPRNPRKNPRKIPRKNPRKNPRTNPRKNPRKIHAQIHAQVNANVGSLGLQIAYSTVQHILRTQNMT